MIAEHIRRITNEPIIHRSRDFKLLDMRQVIPNEPGHPNEQTL